jgi:hypothetical protein
VSETGHSAETDLQSSVESGIFVKEITIVWMFDIGRLLKVKNNYSFVSRLIDARSK